MADMVFGFLAPWLVYGLILALHLALPARTIVGYVRDPATNKPLTYRINGLLVLAAAASLLILAGRFGLAPLDWLYSHRWSGLAGACTAGLLFSFAVVLPVKSRGQSFPTEFFLGRLDNPQFFNKRVDAKMFLYLVGATMLALNLLSFTAHHLLIYGNRVSPGIMLYTCLFLWFVVEYLYFERVHLYTYDLVAERVGFKLGWGCLTFYPYFYGIGLWATVDLPDPHAPVWQLVASACIFFAGWVLARGANMQKFFFKTDPTRPFLGLIRPKTLTDGKQAVLCSGFWGVSRHVNYLGEILMATGLTLALGRPGVWAAWLYPLYYVGLLLPRQIDDDRRCAAKYGELWKEYVRRVPWRIVPFVY